MQCNIYCGDFWRSALPFIWLNAQVKRKSHKSETDNSKQEIRFFSLHPRCVVTGEYCSARAPLELLVDVGWTESEGHSFDKLGLSLCRSTHQRIQRPAVYAERREFKLVDAIWPPVPGHGSDKISLARSERRNAHWVCRLPELRAF